MLSLRSRAVFISLWIFELFMLLKEKSAFYSLKMNKMGPDCHQTCTTGSSYNNSEQTLLKHMHAKRCMQKSDAMIIGQKLALSYTHKHQIFRLFKRGCWSMLTPIALINGWKFFYRNILHENFMKFFFKKNLLMKIYFKNKNS